MSPNARSWDGMRLHIEGLLERRTGEGVDAWNRRIAETGLSGEASVREWLTAQGVDGYPRMLLLMERFGYPDYLLAGADQLIGGQYADRPHLRPILDAILAAAPGLGDDVDIQARKTYVTLLTSRRTFGVVQATTKSRVDLGLRLDGVAPQGRLVPAGNVGNDAITLRIGLTAVDEVDDEVLGWLARAYAASA
ncbi:MAG TPA: DUF5655 domain-containing protein [Actinomycetota bacterium]|nr:DUF5655 domain-containing protein [Actinomycetota bacterium]